MWTKNPPERAQSFFFFDHQFKGNACAQVRTQHWRICTWYIFASAFIIIFCLIVNVHSFLLFSSANRGNCHCPRMQLFELLLFFLLPPLGLFSLFFIRQFPLCLPIYKPRATSNAIPSLVNEFNRFGSRQAELSFLFVLSVWFCDYETLTSGKLIFLHIYLIVIIISNSICNIWFETKLSLKSPK